MAFEPERWTILAIVVGVVLLTAGGLNDPFIVPKATLLYVGAAVLIALVGWRFASDAAAQVPRTKALWIATAAVAAMALATVLGDEVSRSIYGEYGRSAGLLTYATAMLVVLPVTLLAFDVQRLPTLAATLAWVAGIVVALAALQAIDIDLVLGNDVADRIVATLGQSNFVAGFLGVGLPFALWAAMRRGSSALRVVGAGTLVLAPVVAIGAKSFQAMPASVASLAVVLLIIGLDRWPRRRILIVGAAGFAALVVVSALFAGRIADELDASFDERLLFWDAGVEMVADSPIVGWGPSGFASEFTRFRDPEHAVRFGPFQIADAPHDVPLGMFVAGGVLLGAAYLAFCGFVLVRLVRAVRGRAESPDVGLLAAFAGAWVGYQVQSLVSIDVPTFVVLHVVVAAGVLVLAGDGERRVLSLPWRPAAPRRGSDPKSTTVKVGAVVVALVLTWFGVQPLLADRAHVVGRERRADAQGDQDLLAAIDSLEHATELAPWNATYWAELAAARQQIGDGEGAVEAGAEAASHAPSAISYALAVAQLSHRLGDDDTAEQYFEMALRHGPTVPAALAANAEFRLDRGEVDRAIELVQEALDRGGETVEHLTILARAHEANGDDELALDTWHRVLAIQPQNAAAVTAVEAAA